MKKIIKKFLGEKVTYKLRIWIKYIKSLPRLLSGNAIVVNKNLVRDLKVYELKHKNVFCGYYDLNPIKDEKMLVHVVSKNACPNIDSAELGYFDLSNDKYNRINITRAWCFQQGSRLRWSNNEKDVIYYNDVSDDGYCFKKYNIKTKELLKTIPSAIYDFDKDEKYGISLNFSRLQRLRPGYGYSNFKDETEDENAPIDDGLFIVDLRQSNKKMLISLYDLAMLVDSDLKYQHYLNHISFSPDGKKVMFFHLWTESGKFNWRNQLCIIDIDGNNFKVLENHDLVSHYDWKDNENLLITGVNFETKEEFYRYYNIKNGDIIDLNDSNLKSDGHPTHSEDLNIFYSDTYPDNNCMQKLFKYDIETKSYQVLVKLFSNPKLDSEKRCDLHPKLNIDKNEILVDTTFKNCKRSVVLVSLKGLSKNGKKRKKTS